MESRRQRKGWGACLIHHSVHRERCLFASALVYDALKKQEIVRGDGFLQLSFFISSQHTEPFSPKVTGSIKAGDLSQS